MAALSLRWLNLLLVWVCCRYRLGASASQTPIFEFMLKYPSVLCSFYSEVQAHGYRMPIAYQAEAQRCYQLPMESPPVQTYQSVFSDLLMALQDLRNATATTDKEEISSSMTWFYNGVKCDYHRNSYILSHEAKVGLIILAVTFVFIAVNSLLVPFYKRRYEWCYTDRKRSSATAKRPSQSPKNLGKP